MSAEQRVVCQDDPVADDGIVPHVGARHEEAMVSHDRRLTSAGGAVNRAILADSIAVSDPNLALHAGVEGDILRVRADDCTVTDRVVRAHNHMTGDDRVGLNVATISDAGRTFDDRERADRDIRTNLRVGVNKSGGMDRHGKRGGWRFWTELAGRVQPAPAPRANYRMPASRKLNQGRRPLSAEPRIT